MALALPVVILDLHVVVIDLPGLLERWVVSMFWWM